MMQTANHLASFVPTNVLSAADGSARIRTEAPAGKKGKKHSSAPTLQEINTDAASTPTVTPPTLIVPGQEMHGQEMRATMDGVFVHTTFHDLRVRVAKFSVQLPMLLDQLSAFFNVMSDEARDKLRFHGKPGALGMRTRMRLCDLAVIKAFVKHTITKSPTGKKTAEYNEWQCHVPPKCKGLPCSKDVYVFVGQFPMALSAEDIGGIFTTATGIVPLRIDHLPKGAKVFLRTVDEVEAATRWHQTVQVTEDGTLFGALPDSTDAEVADAREQLMMMRKEVDVAFQRAFQRTPRHNPYDPTLIHPKNMLMLASAAQPEKRAPKKKAGGPAEPPLVRIGLDRNGNPVRNGTYPMTIEAPKVKNDGPLDAEIVA